MSHAELFYILKVYVMRSLENAKAFRALSYTLKFPYSSEDIKACQIKQRHEATL